MKRRIFHIDVNSAYLSWEAVYRLWHEGSDLDLREIPSAVIWHCAGESSWRNPYPRKNMGLKPEKPFGRQSRSAGIWF